MAEIKSTMDIIMEKTKGLTITEEEKKAFKKREISGKLKGIVQKFLDGVVDIDRLKTEMAALGKEEPALTGEIARGECADRIRLGEDNETILKILEATTVTDLTPVRELLTRAKIRLDKERETFEQTFTQKLVEKGVSGSAVIPNTWADPDWRRAASRMEEDLRKEVQELLSA